MNNSKNELAFVIPGHYVPKNTDLNSKESRTSMIRVLGEDPNKDDHFLTQDGDSLPEYYILQNYDFFPTKQNDGSRDRKNNPNMLKGIEDAPKYEDFNTGAGEEAVAPIPTAVNRAVENEGARALPEAAPLAVPKDVQIAPEDKFLLDLLEKIKLAPGRTVNVPVYIELELPYDFEKLQNSIDLLSLDKIKISNILYGQNTEEIHAFLIRGIASFLSKTHQPIKVVQPEYMEPLVEPVPAQAQESTNETTTTAEPYSQVPTNFLEDDSEYMNRVSDPSQMRIRTFEEQSPEDGPEEPEETAEEQSPEETKEAVSMTDVENLSDRLRALLGGNNKQQ